MTCEIVTRATPRGQHAAGTFRDELLEMSPRDLAIWIAAVNASTPKSDEEFTGYAEDYMAANGKGLADVSAAIALYAAAWKRANFDLASSADEEHANPREIEAEAEALLRTGWSP